MSRSGIRTVRRDLCFTRVGVMAATAIAAVSVHPALAAQDDSNVTIASAASKTASETAPNTDVPPSSGLVIDILAPVPEAPYDPGYEAECERLADAGIISGEILVCARRRDDSEFRTTQDSQKRYAEETAFAGDPQAPDVAGPGIFRGPATVSGQCFIPPCPPPKAIFIDVTALPEAPRGSDADRIGRGLPPVGQDEAAIPPIEVIRNDLPGPQIDYFAPTFEDGTAIEAPANSEESEEPEERR